MYNETVKLLIDTIYSCITDMALHKLYTRGSNLVSEIESTLLSSLLIDISGGHFPSVFTVMRSAIDTSRAHHFNMEEFGKGDMSVCEKTITYHHAFYMATLGGAKGKCSVVAYNELLPLMMNIKDRTYFDFWWGLKSRQSKMFSKS